MRARPSVTQVAMLVLIVLVFVVALALRARQHDSRSPAPASAASALDPFGSSTESGSSSTGRPASSVGTAATLALGQCFNADRFTVGAPLDPSTVHVVACTDPHQHEVFATFTHPDRTGAPYPSDATLDAWAEDHCVAAFADYVGIELERSHLDIATFRPAEATWKTGDRAVACAAHDTDFALLQATVKGSKK